MSYSITPRDLAFAHHAASRALSSVKKVEAESHLKSGVRTGFACATSFGFGMLSGYAGSVDIFGKAPLDGTIGAVASILAYTGVAGSQASVLQGIGDGALAAYLTKKGAAMGDAMRRKAGKKIGHPAFPSSSGVSVLTGADRRPLSNAELSAMASVARAHG